MPNEKTPPLAADMNAVLRNNHGYAHQIQCCRYPNRAPTSDKVLGRYMEGVKEYLGRLGFDRDVHVDIGAFAHGLEVGGIEFEVR